MMASIGHAQGDADEKQRRTEIEQKIRRGDPITPEEQKYLEKILQRRNLDWAKTHPPHDSLGLVPLPDLGIGTYKGEQGGLYPGGSDEPPAAHRSAGLRIARSIQPIDGKIVLISTGMSNTHVESEVFAEALHKAAGVNPKVLFVDCAQGGGDGAVTANPDANYWRVAEKTLAAAGVTPQQVQVAWIKQTIGNRSEEFPADARKVQAAMVATLHNLHDKYPNLKIAYLSTRIYAGYAKSPLSPEPYAYEDGFGMKWLIADQISGQRGTELRPGEGRSESAMDRVGAVSLGGRRKGPQGWLDLRGRRLHHRRPHPPL